MTLDFWTWKPPKSLLTSCVGLILDFRYFYLVFNRTFLSYFSFLKETNWVRSLFCWVWDAQRNNLFFIFGANPCHSIPCLFCVSDCVLHAYALLIFLLFAGQQWFQVLDCSATGFEFCFESIDFSCVLFHLLLESNYLFFSFLWLFLSLW